MLVTSVLTLWCFVIGLQSANADEDIAPSIRQAEKPLSIVVNDFLLKGRTKGANCPPRINIKAVRAIGETSFEKAIATSDPGARRLALGRFFAVARVKDVVLGGTQCTGASETVLIAPASLPKLIDILQAAPPSPSGRLFAYGNLIRAMAKHANDSTKAVGTLLPENDKPVKCGKYPYPGFVFFLTDIAKDAKLVAARLKLKAADQKKNSLLLITSPSTPVTARDLRAFESGALPMCAYGISGNRWTKPAANATSSTGTGAAGASASAGANASASSNTPIATATTGSTVSPRGTSSSTSLPGKGVSASAGASTETGPKATATTSGVSPPDATSSTSASGTGASASADTNTGTGPKATATTSGTQPPGNSDSGGSAFSSSESSVDGPGSVSCRKSTSHQGSGSSSASCR